MTATEKGDSSQASLADIDITQQARERYNRTLLDMLATWNHPFAWEDQLLKVCMAYNTSVHASTGYTPFFLMFGRQARMPIDLMYGMGNEKEVPTT